MGQLPSTPLEDLSADELSSMLDDPDVCRYRDETWQRIRHALTTVLRAEEEPLVRDLARSGVEVESVWDLVNTSREYPTAIPVLVEHLSKAYHPSIKEGIARALTIPEAGPLASVELMREFRESDDTSTTGYRWALSNALRQVADAAILDDLVDVVADSRLDPAFRENLIWAFGRLWREPRALESLRDLRSDDRVGNVAFKVLRRYRKA